MKRLFLGIIALAVFAQCSLATEALPKDLVGVGVAEKIRDKIPLDLIVTNQLGKNITLKSLFDEKRPVILTFAYFNCPMLCNLLLDDFTETLKKSHLVIGKDMQIVTVSFDPRDGVQEALRYHQKFAGKLVKKNQQDSWQFVTTSQQNIEKLTRAAGYHFRPTDNHDFAHPAAIIFLTPQGEIARYLYGVTFSPFELKLAVLEASNRSFISTIEQGILFCYNYDPQSRSYVLQAITLMRIGAFATVVFLVILLLSLRYREARKRKN